MTTPKEDRHQALALLAVRAGHLAGLAELDAIGFDEPIHNLAGAMLVDAISEFGLEELLGEPDGMGIEKDFLRLDEIRDEIDAKWPTMSDYERVVTIARLHAIDEFGRYQNALAASLLIDMDAKNPGKADAKAVENARAELEALGAVYQRQEAKAIRAAVKPTPKKRGRPVKKRAA